MTEETQVRTEDRETVRVAREIMRQVRVIAAVEEIGVSEALEQTIRGPVQRRYEKAREKVAAQHDLGGEGG